METLTTLLIHQARYRILEESIPRIRTCLGKLNDAQIWFRPNPDMASIGNLVLHLCGNARQWILAGMLGQVDQRDRDAEFDEPGPLPPDQLVRALDELEQDLAAGLAMVTTEHLLKTYSVQVFYETGVSVLIHVIEHMSYHTGQIARDTKRMLSIDLGFYDDLDL